MTLFNYKYESWVKEVSLIPRLLPSFCCDKKLGNSQGVRLQGKYHPNFDVHSEEAHTGDRESISTDNSFTISVTETQTVNGASYNASKPTSSGWEAASITCSGYKVERQHGQPMGKSNYNRCISRNINLFSLVTI